MHFGLILAHQNIISKIRTLYILKMLYTECSTNGAIAQDLSQRT